MVSQKVKATCVFTLSIRLGKEVVYVARVRQKEERARVAVTRGNQGWPAAANAPGGSQSFSKEARLCRKAKLLEETRGLPIKQNLGWLLYHQKAPGMSRLSICSKDHWQQSI